MNDVELKFCPFCGSKAEIYQHHDSRWTVECTACFAAIWPRKNKEQAIEAWNRRVDNGRYWERVEEQEVGIAKYYEDVTVKNALGLLACFSGSKSITRDDIQNLMERMLPADVVAVVRCKDCKYCQHGTNHPLWCNAWCSENDSYRMNKVEADGFCYRGKRKEGREL